MQSFGSGINPNTRKTAVPASDNDIVNSDHFNVNDVFYQSNIQKRAENNQTIYAFHLEVKEEEKENGGTVREMTDDKA